ncbi:MAG: hypothetical protein ACK55Z_16350, partial [bacterium]
VQGLPFDAQVQGRGRELIDNVLGLDIFVDGHLDDDFVPAVLVPERQPAPAQPQPTRRDGCSSCARKHTPQRERSGSTRHRSSLSKILESQRPSTSTT